MSPATFHRLCKCIGGGESGKSIGDMSQVRSGKHLHIHFLSRIVVKNVSGAGNGHQTCLGWALPNICDKCPHLYLSHISASLFLSTLKSKVRTLQQQIVSIFYSNKLNTSPPTQPPSNLSNSNILGTKWSLSSPRYVFSLELCLTLTCWMHFNLVECISILLTGFVSLWHLHQFFLTWNRAWRSAKGVYC